MKNIVLFGTLFVAVNCTYRRDIEKSLRDLDYYVELTNFPDDMLDYTLAVMTEAYEYYDADVLKIVPHVHEALHAEYEDKHWFAVVNYEQTTFTYNYSLSVTEKSHNDKYTIGNLVGCTKNKK